MALWSVIAVRASALRIVSREGAGTQAQRAAREAVPYGFLTDLASAPPRETLFNHEGLIS